MVKNPPANAGDMGSSPGPGRSHIKKKKKKDQSGFRVCSYFPCVEDRCFLLNRDHNLHLVGQWAVFSSPVHTWKLH